MIESRMIEQHGRETAPRSSAAPIIVGTALFLITAAVNLEVPLYGVYAAGAGFGAGLTAVVFAAYIGALVPTLIVFGGISDRVGRKPILLVGLGCAILATALMIFAPSVTALFVARVLQGIGVGLSIGAGTAFLAELLGGAAGAARAASLAAVTTSLGFGSGALLTSAGLATVSTVPPISYVLVALLALGCFLAVSALRVRGGVTGTGALLRLPYYPTGVWGYGVAIAVAWAVTGLVIAVVPGELAQHGLGVWSGPTLFLVNGTGALMQPLARRLAPVAALRVGFVLLPLGYGLLVLGAWQGVLPGILAGAMLAGAACYGFTYLGGLSAVSVAGGVERARAVSGYFLCAYLGLGLPSIAVGFLADRIGIVTALVGFGVVLCIADVALAARLRPGVAVPSIVATGAPTAQ